MGSQCDFYKKRFYYHKLQEKKAEKEGQDKNLKYFQWKDMFYSVEIIPNTIITYEEYIYFLSLATLILGPVFQRVWWVE